VILLLASSRAQVRLFHGEPVFRVIFLTSRIIYLIMSPLFVGTSSCTALSGIVGDNACNGNLACDGSDGSFTVSIDSNSCNGGGSCDEILNANRRKLQEEGRKLQGGFDFIIGANR
jgi:hypothetical protein